MAVDVVVIGAGLAGLRAGARLAESGLEVELLEASDAVGGRQRTDAVDGFLLDRGFQILNPAYPAVRRWVDLPALRLKTFPVGVRVRREGRSVELRHPLRHPAGIAATLRSGLIRPRDIAALARWLGPALVRPKSMIRGDDRPLDQGWDRAGVRGPLRTEVLEPFLTGVLAEADAQTSDAFARLLVRMFALGSPGVPARGMQALPAQLAARATVSGAGIRLGARAARVRASAAYIDVDIDGGDARRARAVIVAVGPEAAGELVDIAPPVTRGLQTWWFAPDAAPPASALLAVDGRRGGPVVNTVVMSHSAPSYAPPGRHLVQATCLLASGATEADVRRQLSEIWEVDTRPWSLLRRDDIVHALPSQPAPLRTVSPARVAERLYVAGDHRDTASIQGALVSGDRVARAVLRDLGTARPPAGAG